MANTIVIKGDPLRKEGIANATIRPGELIEFRTAGGALGNLQVHSTSDGVATPRFALENSITGEEPDQSYSSGETVLYGVFRKGDEVQARLASGLNVQKGNPLSSDGNGELQDNTTTNPVCQAAEDKDATGGIADIKVEIM